MSDHDNGSPSQKDGKFDKRAEALRRNLRRRKEEAKKKQQEKPSGSEENKEK